MKTTVVAAIVALTATAAAAQNAGPRLGWGMQVDALALYQGETSLDNGQEFSANRGFLRASGLYRMENGVSVGLSASFGQLNYDFTGLGNEPWDTINDVRISVPIRYPVNERATVFVAPSLRFDYQDGATMSDGQSWGAFGGVSWKFSETLTIGPAAGAFSRIDDSSLEVFPALLVNWQIADRLTLSTSQAAGATQGPGAVLSYAVNDDWNVSLAGRYENIRFRLDDDGAAAGGVGQDSSIPIVLTLGYEPAPYFRAAVFAGTEVNGRLKLREENDTVVYSSGYDMAPVGGFTLRLRF